MTDAVLAPATAGQVATARERDSAPTLHDVALAAGVSLTTASRVLNGSVRTVTAEYRDRVEAAATSLGYAANSSAQAIARGSSTIVALLVADITDPYFGQIAAGVARGADEAGLVVTIAITERDPEREARLVRALRGQRPRALILAASRSSASAHPAVQAEIDALTLGGCRIVVFGPSGASVRSVIVDNENGARSLGLSLGARGYRRAIVLAAAEGFLTSDDRILGFHDGFTAAGGMVVRVRRGDFTRESGRRLMSEALIEGVEPGTLVFAVSDVIAIGAMSAVRDADRLIGSDIALCGFDDIPAAHDLTPGLTTVTVPLEDLGYLALRAAVDDECEEHSEILPLDVVIRESTPGRAVIASE